METHTPAHIFLADQRGHIETDSVRSYHLFNTAGYVAEGREPFGALHQLSDETLRPGASLTLTTAQPTDVLLLPLLGGIDYTHNGKTSPLDPGHAVLLPLPAGATYRITNPYETEFVHYLHIGLTGTLPASARSVRQTPVDLTTPNQLVPFLETKVTQQAGYQGYIGRYGGREEDTYAIDNVPDGQPRRVFVVVVQGVFDVANRLLHEKDALALTYEQAGILEFEALSNDALLLVIDQFAAV